MKIAVIGATGMIGSRAVAEAARRGHTVDAYSRSGRLPEGATEAFSLDTADTQKTVDVIADHDFTILTVVNGRTGDFATDIENHRALIAARPRGRFLVVGGAGALQADEHTMLKDTEGFPAEYKIEADSFAQIYLDYVDSEGLEWSMLAPAPVIAPGERTGQYTVALDVPAGDSVSAEDFAVALIDEAEMNEHTGKRFTVAN
ncbi:NAD(P)-dependent oxidoreductase [Kocuria sp. HSID16901]|uniref:NAD(P)-dependent oxidoreductase n=1 Tax=Kocuria sp. HSID16901 TaxID=2419505 RepID=UPI000660A7A3|nr:NAD(P)H-binding protein [Kocuria sp. HSID16901]RUQ22685.1 NAD-dependent epimerase/dehydratase family protein [Kocuria sp. HSID16901]